MYTLTKDYGQVKDVVFKDISVIGDRAPKSIFKDFDSVYNVENVSFENLRFGGKVITDLESGRIEIGKFVKNVRIDP